MKKTMKNYIKNCSICVMTKTSRIDKKEQLQSFSISNVFFETMTLNFVTKLSKSSNSTTRQFYDMIMTIMNELIKYAKFISCKTTLNAKKLIFLLLKIVFVKHDILEKIILNRDKLFISNFMRELIIFIDAN